MVVFQELLALPVNIESIKQGDHAFLCFHVPTQKA